MPATNNLVSLPSLVITSIISVPDMEWSTINDVLSASLSVVSLLVKIQQFNLSNIDSSIF